MNHLYVCIASFRKQALEDASSTARVLFCENLDYFNTSRFFGICFSLYLIFSTLMNEKELRKIWAYCLMGQGVSDKGHGNC